MGGKKERKFLEKKDDNKCEEKAVGIEQHFIENKFTKDHVSCFMIVLVHTNHVICINMIALFFSAAQ
jgi:hypothetical protein